jgi:hypothetical protein
LTMTATVCTCGANRVTEYPTYPAHPTIPGVALVVDADTLRTITHYSGTVKVWTLASPEIAIEVHPRNILMTPKDIRTFAAMMLDQADWYENNMGEIN